MTDRQGVTFVSVVFEAEIPLLRLQARSMSRFLPRDLVREIILIDNSAHGLPRAELARIHDSYGDVADLTRVLRPADICAVPGARGWRAQQVLKLAVSELISSDRYLVLDAKNHFVAELRPDFIASPDGRSRMNAYGYTNHPLRGDLEHVLAYLHLDPAGLVERFTATVTPFVLDTAVVRAMMADIQSRSGRSFAQEFILKDLTEFFLYSGWILTQGRTLEEAFDIHQVFCPVVWPKAANLAGVQAAVATATEQGTPLFTVHSRGLAVLDAAGSQALAQFWAERDLFGSAAEAVAFIDDFQAAYQREMKAQRLRDLPHRVTGLPRAVKRRVLGRLRRR